MRNGVDFLSLASASSVAPPTIYWRQLTDFVHRAVVASGCPALDCVGSRRMGCIHTSGCDLISFFIYFGVCDTSLSLTGGLGILIVSFGMLGCSTLYIRRFGTCFSFSSCYWYVSSVVGQGASLFRMVRCCWIPSRARKPTAGGLHGWALNEEARGLA